MSSLPTLYRKFADSLLTVYQQFNNNRNNFPRLPRLPPAVFIALMLLQPDLLQDRFERTGCYNKQHCFSTRRRRQRERQKSNTE